LFLARKSINKDKCDDWCKNGGSCVKVKKKKTCTCLAGFSGKRCEQDLCECKNGGTCLIQGNSFKCLCRSSFTGDKCEIIVKGSDICDYFCKNGGSCLYEGGRNPPVCRFVVLNHIPFNSFKPT